MQFEENARLALLGVVEHLYPDDIELDRLTQQLHQIDRRDDRVRLKGGGMSWEWSGDGTASSTASRSRDLHSTSTLGSSHPDAH